MFEFNYNLTRIMGTLNGNRWPNVVSNKDLRKVTGHEDINVEIRKKKT